MKFLDFFRRGTRAQFTRADAPLLDYTALAQEFQYGDAHTGTDNYLLGAVESAVAYIENAFSQATIEPTGTIDTRDLMPLLRALILDGNAVGTFEPRGDRAGAYNITPASSYQVFGETPDPMAWSYSIHLSGPTGSSEVRRPARTVLHFRKGTDIRHTYRGQSTLHRARATMAAAHQTEHAAMGDMRGANLRAVIGTDPSMSGVRGQQRDEITRTMWESFGRAAEAGRIPVLPPGFLFTPTPSAAGPRQGLSTLRESLCANVAALVGVPPMLLGLGGNSVAGAREAYRQFAATTMAALGSCFAHELELKLGMPIQIGFGKLMASDMAGKARSYSVLVGAGYPPEKASAILGL